MISKDGRFEIVEDRRDSDSYMYSYSSYSWQIIVTATGDQIASYYGRDDEDSSGRTTSGVEYVTFSDDGNNLRIHYYDGHEEFDALPVNAELLDKGRTLELTWPNGRKEQRIRSSAFMVTKYGQPIQIRELKTDPKSQKISKKSETLKLAKSE